MANLRLTVFYEKKFPGLQLFSSCYAQIFFSFAFYFYMYFTFSLHYDLILLDTVIFSGQNDNRSKTPL